MRIIVSKLKQFLCSVPLWLIHLLSIIFTIMASFMMMEYPTVVICGFSGYLAYAFYKSVVLNLLSIGMIWSVFLIVSNRVWLSNLLCGCFCGIVAVINYYVVTLHGMPLSFLLLRNFQTAMNVISSYSIAVDKHAARILALLILVIMLVLITRWISKGRCERKTRSHIIIRDVLLLAVCSTVFYFGYLGKNPVKPVKTIGWGWQEAYSTYGYLPCTIETLFQSLSDIDEPAGYTEQAVDSLEIADKKKEEPVTPDIILILNESFSDLRQLTDIKTDVPFLENIEGIENLLTGYAISPSAGGEPTVLSMRYCPAILCSSCRV